MLEKESAITSIASRRVENEVETRAYKQNNILNSNSWFHTIKSSGSKSVDENITIFSFALNHPKGSARCDNSRHQSKTQGEKLVSYSMVGSMAL